MSDFSCNDDFTECWMEGEGTKRDIDQWHNNIKDYYDICDIEVLSEESRHISWSNLYMPKHAIHHEYGTDVIDQKIKVHIKKYDK